MIFPSSNPCSGVHFFENVVSRKWKCLRRWTLFGVLQMRLLHAPVERSLFRNTGALKRVGSKSPSGRNWLKKTARYSLKLGPNRRAAPAVFSNLGDERKSPAGLPTSPASRIRRGIWRGSFGWAKSTLRRRRRRCDPRCCRRCFSDSSRRRGGRLRR